MKTWQASGHHPNLSGHCLSEVSENLLEISENNTDVISWFSLEKKNGAGDCWSSKRQLVLVVLLVSMSWNTRMSTTSAIEGLVLEDHQYWGWGEKNHSPHLLWRVISALQSSLMRCAMTTCALLIWYCHWVMKFTFAWMTEKTKTKCLRDRRWSWRLFVVGPG